MQMLMLVFRESLEAEIQELFQELKVTSFTQMPKVLGMGETGTAFNSFESPGCNSMILVAMEDGKVQSVLERLKGFRDKLSQRQHGTTIPLRVFVLPCHSVL